MLSFYTLNVKKGMFSFLDTEEKIDIETWIIPIQLLSTPKSNVIKQVRKSIRNDFINRMLYILQMVNEKRNHLPPSSINHFSISFIVGNEHIDASSSDNKKGWSFNMFKEMLHEGPPLLLR